MLSFQDLTYWGFDGDDQVSAWIALSPATGASGCMQMIPESHKQPMQEQVLTDDPANLLSLGQTIVGVSSDDAVLCPLEPGQASLHHGWTVHASTANESNDRRIGLNIQYIKPSMRQQNVQSDSALLVPGRDSYGHFRPDRTPPSEIPADAKQRLAQLSGEVLEITRKGSRL